MSVVGFRKVFLSFSLSLSSHAIFSRHDNNPINLVNSTQHQSKPNYTNFLLKLPFISSSSHTWNVINHFSNQTSTHAAHSNQQLNNELFNNSANAQMTTSNQNPRDEQFAIRFDNELRHRHSGSSTIINRNHYTGMQYSHSNKSCACDHRQTSIIYNTIELIIHFIDNYHAISYVLTGIIFYAILFYVFFGY